MSSSAACLALSPSHLDENSSDAEDVMAYQTSDEGDYTAENPSTGDASSKWIDVVSRAQRRRMKKTAQQPDLTPTKPAIKPTAQPTGKPKPPPLPFNDYKLVIRPQGGLNLAKVSPTELSEVLLRATKLTWRKAEFRLRIHGVQNTAMVSTSHREAAEALHHLKQVMFGGTVYPVQLYGLAPDDSVKGVIHDIPLHYSSQEILENIFLPGFEFIACRRLGNSTTVIVTILGKKVPFYVYHLGAEHRCYLYRKTVPACTICHELGHRSTACPCPNVRACPTCGTRDPVDGHVCKPCCSLCKGEHLTASKGCPQRFCEPYVKRQKELARQRAASQAPADQQQPAPPRGRRRQRPGNTPVRRGSSTSSRRNSRSRSQSRSRSRSSRGAAPLGRRPVLAQARRQRQKSKDRHSQFLLSQMQIPAQAR
ncbi:hypothetical protein HPB48_026310 [Haemaphysalis longicornis]|uniref:Uncharacterized protein n=1 Tax=Haemaphysalis longicornis TaxID=44386 RepID=A0A9J6HC44_HAELO|nr:hypothetical protein HPB48_026310 [Haemaphysalis longicornis]